MGQDFMKQPQKSYGQKEGKLSSKTKRQRNTLMTSVGSAKVSVLFKIEFAFNTYICRNH